MERAVARGDWRFAGVAGYAVVAPGIDLSDPRYPKDLQEIRVIEGTSDMVLGEAGERLNQVAAEYAQQYNRLLLKRLRGQTTGRFPPGSRLILRGFLLPARGLKVQVLEDRGDTLLVAPDHRSERLAVPTRNVHRIQSSLGKRSNTAIGMLIGCFSGLVVGFGLGESDYIHGAVYGALAGTALGAAAGAAIQTEKWGPVIPLRPRAAQPPRSQ